MDNADYGYAMEIGGQRDAIKVLEHRVSVLERLCACNNCMGRGTVQTRWGPDECPHCRGTRLNPVLTGDA